VTIENNPDKPDNNEGQESSYPYSPSQYPGYGYPRPSSVQPPATGNYPYPLPPETGSTPQNPYTSNYPYPQSTESTPSSSSYPYGSSQPSAANENAFQSPHAWLEDMRQQGYAPPAQTPEERARVTPLPLPTHPVMATYVLLGLIIAMYLISLVVDGRGAGLSFGDQFRAQTLLNLGALYSESVRAGEWWRLITVMFLHANLLHIFLNGFNLYALGKQLEALFGPVRYTAIFFISGLTGSVASFGLHDEIFAVGASGAIFGLVGALIGYFVRQRNQFGFFGRYYLRSLLTTVGINFVILFFIPGVDNIAHLGGLVGGLVLGYLTSPLYDFSQLPGGRLKITQRDKGSTTWLLFALGWLVVVVAAFMFFLNR
jgi:rhomboid protease GluP